MKTINRTPKTKRQLQILMRNHMDSHCKDRCLDAKESCAYYKTCDVIFQALHATFILLLLCIPLSSQQLSKKYVSANFTSYISYSVACPMYVSYNLYKGGGNCSRDTMTWKCQTDSIGIESSYLHSGFDKGHLCAAEDFAYDCTLESNTFRYENAIPQKPGLNRGSWAMYEANIRSLSKKNHMFIICGGFQWGTKIGKISVPKMCFKVYKNLTTNKITYMIFQNTQQGTYSALDSLHFYRIVPYQLQNLLK